MCTNFLDTLTGGNIREAQEVVCGDGVNGRRVERPLEVEDGCFMEAGQEAVVGVWRIGPPECCQREENATRVNE